MLFITGIVIFLFFKRDFQNTKPLLTLAGLDNHPIYNKYKFVTSKQNINIGIQPLYMPTGLITEVVKRDKILHLKLKKLSVKFNFFSFLKGADVNFFMEKDQLNIGIGGDMPFITIASKISVKSPIRVQEGFISIVANLPTLIPELKNKKIGYAFGSNAHYALLDILGGENLTEQDITLIPVDVTQMSNALGDHDIDAFAAWEPTPALAIKENPGFVTIHKKMTTGYLYYQSDLIRAHPKALKEICAAFLRSILWMQDDPQNLKLASSWVKQEIEILTSKKFLLTINEIAELAMNDIIGNPESPAIDKSSLQINNPINKEFKFLKNTSKISQDVAWEKIMNSFNFLMLEEVYNNSEEYDFSTFDYLLNSTDN